ncbi:MAG: nitroreductase family protein, partial [Bacteroidales bacterium]|nr:nitroreductase family protein [Bacteroidales bacterium]
MDTLKTRRTVRSYADRDVEAALLRELLETAMRSSNTGNMQAYSVVASRSDAVKQALAPLHFNQAQVTTAPV